MLHFEEMLSRVIGMGKKVTIVLSIPTGSELDPRRMCVRSFLGGCKLTAKQLSREQFMMENRALTEELASIATKLGAEVIEPMDFLCDNGICLAVDGRGIPIR